MSDAGGRPFRDLLGNSAFLKKVEELKGNRPSRLFGDVVRPLSPREIKALRAQGNTADDWRQLRVAPYFRTDFVQHNSFSGACVLGVYSGAPREAAPGVSLPDGIYGSTIVASEIASGCLVKDCGLVARYVIEEGVVLMGLGALTASPECSFGNGVRIPVGCETGGREVVSCAELDIDLAARVALQRSDRAFLDEYAACAERYRDRASCGFGIIETGASVLRTTEIRNAFIGAGARIDGAALVENCALLSHPDERTVVGHGAIIRNSCIQWGAAATTMAIIEDSILSEHSHVERHGKVTNSIIGPNTGVAEGEVTSCLLGPFVGFHHQALLIAALWPAGKGNVAYGANVGSNHTSRAPDQEIFCGEGVFFGLGANIKFPADYSNAPYSVIATGVSTLPQRVCFPFSLIAPPARSLADVSPAFNELIPGWVLSDNVYMVRRNEEKYKKRNKAKRTVFDFTVFRPDVIDLMTTARERLAAVKETKPVYTDKDVPGLGKNYLLEEQRRRGIEAYDFYIELYCLAALRDRLAGLPAGERAEAGATVYRDRTADANWEHARGLLADRGYDRRPAADNLSRLIGMLERVSLDIGRAKARDDERGARVIPDYGAVAVRADDDDFVSTTRAETASEAIRIRTLIGGL